MRPVACSDTQAVPSAEITMPNGWDAAGIATVCTTASVDGDTMLMLAASRLTTQMRPSGARARVRGSRPTAISATRARVAASITLTESLSGLTTHTRADAPLRGSTRIGADDRPLCPPTPCTDCRNVRDDERPSSVRALKVTW